MDKIEKKMSHIMLRSCKLGKKQEYMCEIPLEMKKDPDPSQDIHFSSFSYFVSINRVSEVGTTWTNYG